MGGSMESSPIHEIQVISSVDPGSAASAGAFAGRQTAQTLKIPSVHGKRGAATGAPRGKWIVSIHLQSILPNPPRKWIEWGVAWNPL